MTSLQHLRALALAATPGKYHIGHLNENEPDRMDIVAEDGTPVADEVHQRDVNYWMAANPQAVLELIDRLEKAEKWLKEIHAACANDPEVGAWAVVSHAQGYIASLKGREK
jgi:hypothetical protein